MVLPLVQPREAARIRTVNPYGFRTGQWGDLLGVVASLGRPCYVVAFHDEQSSRSGLELDLWVCEDGAGNYEFRADAA